MVYSMNIEPPISAKYPTYVDFGWVVWRAASLRARGFKVTIVDQEGVPVERTLECKKLRSMLSRIPSEATI